MRRLVLLVFLVLAGCSQPTLTPAPPALTAIARLVTEPNATQTRLPSERTALALATRIHPNPPSPEPGQPNATQARLLRTLAPTTTPRPRGTPWWAITPEPTATRTPLPALAAHTFELPPVLARLQGSGEGTFYVPPPEIVLYGNGLLVRSRPISDYPDQPVALQLERGEICALLNTIDQTGFFNYSPRSYGRIWFGNAPTQEVLVSAWASNRAYSQLLERWVWEGSGWYAEECIENPSYYCPPPPYIDPALADTFRLLSAYAPGNFEPLPVESMLVWLLPAWVGENYQPWTVAEPSLQDLADLATSQEGYGMVEVRDPQAVQNLLRQVPNGYYAQDELRYRVLLRPRWPYFDPAAGEEGPRPVEPGTTLSCSPQDGLLPIPR